MESILLSFEPELTVTCFGQQNAVEVTMEVFSQILKSLFTLPFCAPSQMPCTEAQTQLLLDERHGHHPPLLSPTLPHPQGPPEEDGPQRENDLEQPGASGGWSRAGPS